MRVPVISWLIWVGFLVVTNLMFCSGSLATLAGKLFVVLEGLVSFQSGCTGVPGWLTFIQTLTVLIPGLVIIFALLGPVLAGASANPVVGTIISTAVIVAVIALITALIV